MTERSFFKTRGLSPTARSFWAKTSRDDTSAWLSLAQHLADTAGAAQALWNSWVPASLRRRIGELLDVSVADAGTIYVWLAGVHDIGKASMTFQTQLYERGDRDRDAFLNRLVDQGLPVRKNSLERSMRSLPHGLTSRVLIDRWLIDAGLRPRQATGLAAIVDAHHGIRSAPELRADAAAALENYPEVWRHAQRELIDSMAAQTDVHPALSGLGRRVTGDAQQLLTGLVVIADWLASNSEQFPLAQVDDDAERLRAGLDIDLTSPWQAAPLLMDQVDERLRNRFDWPDTFSARPVQRATAERALTEEVPLLTIIEAPTGEGKTEAALLTAEILAARTGAGGVMVAAPTMATADGLFQRVLAWANNASPENTVTSMFLGHSKAHLNQTYSALRRRSRADRSHADLDQEAYSEIATDEPAITTSPSGQTQSTRPRGDVIASEWLSGRRKGILSTFCVGTVDQVLFLALQARYSMLRHVGLAGKVIVIDEVHAYDAYMSEYLAMALTWLARYRVPVVLLSATLPEAQRTHLIDAYRSELHVEPMPSLSTDYPAITTVTATSVQSQAVSAAPEDLLVTTALVPDDVTELLPRLRDALADGGCVLLICNTVRRAQEAYTTLLAEWPQDVELHHAAFVASARATKEAALRAALGPSAHRGNGRPWRRIVVATQVAEQSLDIDVDLLISDIAPMDLLIQRIGRLHRHTRPTTDRPPVLQAPQLWVRGVVDEETPTVDSGTSAVYDQRTLMATLALLRSDVIPHGFARPRDVPHLVQAAYAAEAPAMPATWSEAWQQAVEQSSAARSDAERRAATYRFPPPSKAESLDALYCVQEADVDSACGEVRGLAQVRDADPSVEVIPILASDSSYMPLPEVRSTDAQFPFDTAPPSPTAYALAAATVRLPASMTRYERDFTAVVEQLERTTPVGWRESRWLQGQLALPLDHTTRSIELNGRILVYDAEVGLQDVTAHHGSPSTTRTPE